HHNTGDDAMNEFHLNEWVPGGAPRATPFNCGSLRDPQPPHRRGLVLVLVLIVIAMLSLGAYSFTNLMLAHHEAAVVTGRQTQARSLVDSGVTSVQLFLSQKEADRNSMGGIFDNAQYFGHVAVLNDDDANLRGCFSVVSPNMDSDGNVSGIRHGLEDESS